MRSKILLVFVFFVMPFFTFGQIVEPGEGGTKAPITETIAVLVAGGIALGAKYFSKKKKG
jgi:hypothetical protein